MDSDRLILTSEGSSYVLLKFNGDQNADSIPLPQLRIYFSYAGSSKNEALERARRFGEAFAEHLNTSLEESLEAPESLESEVLVGEPRLNVLSEV